MFFPDTRGGWGSRGFRERANDWEMGIFRGKERNLFFLRFKVSSLKFEDLTRLAFAEEDVFSFVGFENCAWTVRLDEAG